MIDLYPLSDGELETLRTSSGDDVDMSLVDYAVRELRERRAADLSDEELDALAYLREQWAARLFIVGAAQWREMHLRCLAVLDKLLGGKP